MKVRGYGKWNVEEFSSTLIGLSPTAEASENNVIWSMEDLREVGHYDSFVEAFREFLLDDSQDFSDKAKIYFDEVWSSAKCWDYCKWLWGLIAPDQQWPLDENLRPQEPTGKDYQFKPE